MPAHPQKSRIPIVSRDNIPIEIKETRLHAKNILRDGLSVLPNGKSLTPFKNRRGADQLDGPPLPKPSEGCIYLEVDVGAAQADDPKGTRGRRRLVLEFHEKSRTVQSEYYTPDHYRKFSFVRIS